MTTQPDVAVWLLEQVAEDERKVKAAESRARGFWKGTRPWERPAEDDDPLGDLAHLADPQRMLAECEAKRRIVEDHGWEYADSYESWKGDEYRERWGDTRDQRNCTRCGGTQPHVNLGLVEKPVSWPCPTLRYLALPYADRPGYREEWRPFG